jgi:dTDP-alpha-D-glucuronic acid decarboxylase
MARVVVTGGYGFVGSHLAEALIDRGDQVTIFDTTPPPDQLPMIREHARHVQGDIRQPESLAKAITADVDVVYHLASVVGVDQYLARPLDVIDINFTGTRNVLDLAVRAQARVVLASTSEIYGKNHKIPWAEGADRVLGPTTADRWTYSSSKALAEHLTFAFARQHGLAATIVRYFNVYGPRQRPAFVISRSVHRALNGIPPAVYDGGTQTRCFTYVDDAVDGTLRAAAEFKAAGDVFNIGSSTETTVAEVIALIAELTGFGPRTTAVDTSEKLSAAYEDLPRRVPDTAKARAVLGWTCGTSLRAGLAKTISWAAASPWWLALPDSGAST